MSTSKFSRYSSRYGLFAAAALILIAAFSLWNIRQAARTQRATQRAQERAQNEQRAIELLKASHQADNTLTYKATSETMAKYGDRTMKVEAMVLRAPDRLAITYQSGERKGLHTGFNGNYFWRKENKTAPLQTYAMVDLTPSEMAARRLDLTLKNYHPGLLGRDAVDGRAAQIVELRPRHSIDGAQGPIKRLWIDQDTKLTLRIDTFNYKGELVMREELSNLEQMPSIPAEEFVPLPALRLASHGSVLAQEMGNNVRRVEKETGIRPPSSSSLPRGFKRENVGVHHCNNAGKPYKAALTRYSDGVNVLTIFAMRSKPGDGSIGASNGVPDGKGAKLNGSCTFGPGTIVMRDTAQGHLVAVADLPEETLQRVLETAKVEFTDQTSGTR